MCDEKAIIQEVKKGNKEKFEKLFERYKEVLKRYLYFLTLNETLSDDLVQETFLRAYEKIVQYEENYKFSTWLFTIGRNLFYEYCRKNKEKNCVYKEDYFYKERMRMLEERDYDERLDLKKAIGSLDGELRQIVEMKYLFDFRVKDIAEILSLPEGTVKSKLFYAREKIRKYLKGSEENGM